MNTLFVLAIVVVIVFAVVSVVANKNRPKKGHSPIKAKRLISLNEQPTFNRLREALPDHIVLAQVAFSGLLSSTGYATRSRFNRKVADFVVLDKAFNVVAIVELDDSSHKGREEKDADRDAMLAEAGYKIIRYKRTPDLDKLKADFALPPAITTSPIVVATDPSTSTILPTQTSIGTADSKQ